MATSASGARCLCVCGHTRAAIFSRCHNCGRSGQAELPKQDLTIWHSRSVRDAEILDWHCNSLRATQLASMLDLGSIDTNRQLNLLNEVLLMPRTVVEVIEHHLFGWKRKEKHSLRCLVEDFRVLSVSVRRQDAKLSEAVADDAKAFKSTSEGRALQIAITKSLVDQLEEGSTSDGDN